MRNDDASGSTAVAEMAKYFSVSKSNKRSVLCFFVGRKRIGIEAFSQKLKQQNFNLYAQFNIEMIGANETRLSGVYNWF
jgi:Zn-dependent M28 family amino/carboxypeptidase